MFNRLSATTGQIKQEGGFVVPVTIFIQASAYPNAETAQAAIASATQARDRVRSRYDALRSERDQLQRDRVPSYIIHEWEEECDWGIAKWEAEQSEIKLRRVEEDAGIFHPSARDRLDGFIASAIDLLDRSDGDSDLELNGDESDFAGAEDEEQAACAGHGRPFPWTGPGCPISDPDRAIDDDACDDINMDLEPEERVVPDYGINQTQPLPAH